MTHKCRLKKGMIRRISEQFNVHPNYVSMVWRDERNNNAILEAVVREMNEYERQKKHLKRQKDAISKRNASLKH